MKFLSEELIISEDDLIKFNKLSDHRKVGFLDKIIKNLPFYKYVKDSTVMLKQSLIQYGFDTNENKTLEFLSKLRSEIANSTLHLIDYLINEKDLNVNTSWLYEPSLYEGEPADVDFKIKALSYADDTSLQSKANQKISPKALMDDNGNILPVEQIKQILSNISVDNSIVDIVDAIREIEGSVDDTTKQGINNIKQYLINIIANDERTKSYLKDNIDVIDWIEKALDRQTLSHINVNDISEEGIANAIFNYLDDGSDKYINKEREKALTGREILKQFFETENKSYSAETIMNFVFDLVKNRTTLGTRAIKAVLSREKGALSKVLSAKYSGGTLGDDTTPLDELKNDLTDTMLKSLKKVETAIKSAETKKQRQAERETAKEKERLENQTGEDLIKNELKLNTREAVADYVANLEKNEKLRGLVREYVLTRAGKEALGTILNKKYKDSLLGTAMEQLQDDLRDMCENGKNQMLLGKKK